MCLFFEKKVMTYNNVKKQIIPTITSSIIFNYKYSDLENSITQNTIITPTAINPRNIASNCLNKCDGLSIKRSVFSFSSHI